MRVAVGKLRKKSGVEDFELGTAWKDWQSQTNVSSAGGDKRRGKSLDRLYSDYRGVVRAQLGVQIVSVLGKQNGPAPWKRRTNKYCRWA